MQSLIGTQNFAVTNITVNGCVSWIFHKGYIITIILCRIYNITIIWFLFLLFVNSNFAHVFESVTNPVDHIMRQYFNIFNLNRLQLVQFNTEARHICTSSIIQPTSLTITVERRMFKLESWDTVRHHMCPKVADRLEILSKNGNQVAYPSPSTCFSYTNLNWLNCRY